MTKFDAPELHFTIFVPQFKKVLEKGVGKTFSSKRFSPQKNI
jgi:hypothetical protein